MSDKEREGSLPEEGLVEEDEESGDDEDLGKYMIDDDQGDEDAADGEKAAEDGVGENDFVDTAELRKVQMAAF